MMIKVDNFRGIIPRVDPKSLPANNAQIANNMFLASGKPEFINEDDIADAETKEVIAEPDSLTELSAPVAAVGDDYIFDIDDLSCKAWVFRLYNGSLAYTWNPTLTRTDYMFTETGIRVTFRLPVYPSAITYPVSPEDDPQTNEFRGANFQLILSGLGSIPSVAPSTIGSAQFGANSYSLTTGGQKYGEFKILSVENGNIVQTKVQKPSTKGNVIYLTDTLGQRDITFNISLNYNLSLPSTTYYIQTYVDGTGREGPPSDVSNEITRIPGKKVTVTCEAGARLYRSSQGQREQGFYFLADSAGASYEDWKEDSGLGEAVAEFYGNRVDDMESFTKMPGDFLVAFKDATVYFSAPGKDYVWPEEYQFPLDIYNQDGDTGVIVGIEVVDDSVYVLTNGTPYVISGTHPGTMSQRKLIYYLPCLGAESICRYDQTVYYASAEGLVMMRGIIAKVVSYPFFSADGWDALSPDSMKITRYGDRLFVSEINTSGSADEPLGVTATGLLFELKDYYPENLITLNGDEKMTWRSREYQLPHPLDWSCARVIADAYDDVTMNIYAKDSADDTEATLVNTRTITSDEAFRLPTLYQSKIWFFEVIASGCIIDEVILSQSMTEVRNG